MRQFKPMLASDYDESKIVVPCILQPKIDGVRAMHMVGQLTGRSLRPHANKHTTAFFSHPALAGFDGEMAADHETHPNLCTLTSSALNSIQGTPDIIWHLFDYITEETKDLAYAVRYARLQGRLAELKQNPDLDHITQCLRIVPTVLCQSIEEFHEVKEHWLDEGYEGMITRRPEAPVKFGRSTVREGGLLRVKGFIEAEAVITGITEGRTNLNEAKKNELGHTERSTHQENMVPNGQVGSLQGQMLADVYDPQIKTKLLLAKGQDVTIAPGKMTAKERAHFFENPHEIVGHAVKFKFFPKGGKDKPRFPTYVTIRPASDMGGE